MRSDNLGVLVKMKMTMAREIVQVPWTQILPKVLSIRNLEACISDLSNLSRLTYGIDNSSPVVRPSSRSKKRSSLLRASFGPGGTSMNDDDGEEATAVFTPKKSSLSRQALEKNARKNSIAPSIAAEDLPHRYSEDRPSYSADVINELKSSTPSTPKDLRSHTDLISSESNELDLAAKFGSNLALHRNPAIPTDAEIKEKKQRRARLAHEQEFINLDSDDQGEDVRDEDDSDADSNEENALLPYAAAKPTKQAPSRLVRDDENVAEGFDEFVSDGRIALGKKAEREQKKRQKAEIRTLINDAEGGSDDSSEDESEVERIAAYEAAQTRKGMEGLKKEDEGAKRKRPRTPPRITEMPSLDGTLEGLEEQSTAREYNREIGRRRLGEVEKELEDIEIRKVELQKFLNESSERFAEMRRVQEAEADGGQEAEADRGQEDQKEEEEDQEAATATPGLGMGMSIGGERPGLSMGMTMAQPGLDSLRDE